MPPKELSPQLAARLGPLPIAPRDDRVNGAAGPSGRGSNGPQPNSNSARAPQSGPGGGTSRYAKLRGIIRAQKEQIWTIQQEVEYYHGKLAREENVHALEKARLQKQIEYHKKLRQGAEQRSNELEGSLLRQQARAHAREDHDSANVELQGLVEQSQVLLSKNSELQYKLQTAEQTVSQLQEMITFLEQEHASVCDERDKLTQYLEKLLAHSSDAAAAALSLEENQDGEGDAELDLMDSLGMLQLANGNGLGTASGGGEDGIGGTEDGIGSAEDGLGLQYTEAELSVVRLALGSNSGGEDVGGTNPGGQALAS